MPKKLTFKRAIVSDLPQVMEVIKSRVRWLEQLGSDQWNTRDFTEDFENSINAGWTWILWESNSPIGVVNLSTIADSDFWSESELTQPSLYLGRMATHVDVRGRGYGELLLALARTYASKYRLPRVRWDVWRGNQALYRFYEEQGGKLIRVVQAPHRGSGALFEMTFQAAPELPSDVNLIDTCQATPIPSQKLTPLLPVDETGIGYHAGVSETHRHKVGSVKLMSQREAKALEVSCIDSIKLPIYFNGFDWHIQDFEDYSIPEWNGLPELNQGMPYLLEHASNQSGSCGVQVVGPKLQAR